MPPSGGSVGRSSVARITTDQSHDGTEIAAVFYTLLETAKLAGVDPAKYLREAALADARGEVLLPADAPSCSL
jgi:hypothetical protein